MFARAIGLPERLRGEPLIIKRYTNKAYLRLLLLIMMSVGYNPQWDDELTLRINVAELAVVNFTVYTKDAFVAQYSLPFRSILQGVCACR